MLLRKTWGVGNSSHLYGTVLESGVYSKNVFELFLPIQCDPDMGVFLFTQYVGVILLGARFLSERVSLCVAVDWCAPGRR